MTITEARENDATFAWEATCEGSTGFTKAEPISSRRLLPKFAKWPAKTFGLPGGVVESDREAAETALAEPGERKSYFEFRDELGL